MAKHDLILLALNPSPILDLMQRALNAAGLQTVIAHERSGMDKILQESIPALAIIGEKFAKQDGFAMTVELLEKFPTLPIIVYAEKDTTGFAKSAIKAGASGYLYPPLKMADVVNEVQRCLARARTLGDWLRREVKRTTSSLTEQANLSETERFKFEAIIANIQDGVIVMDERRRILLANRAVHEIFNLNGREITGKLVEEVISNADLRSLISQSRADALKYYEINFDDGRVFHTQYTPIPNVGAAITMQDISYLKEIDRLKSDFVHTVSHDLRSPLTSVIGYTELIERAGPLNQHQQDFLRRLQGSVQHITALINDLLDLGRLEAGFDARREKVRLDNVLKHSLDMFDTQIKKKNINLTLNVAPDMQTFRANPIRIRQMLDNLLGNAIKYTPEGGKVSVSMFMQDEQIILKIDDTGPGIPAEEHNRIFEKFFRATNAPENVQGTGLGLAIVKSIVDSHQGRVWVESESGKGSSFTVILPTQEE